MAGRATMREIAEKLDISVNAVSLALNNKAGVSEELRMQVLRAADEMGYLGRKEKFLRTFKRTNICVMMQKMYHTDMYFYSKVLYATTDTARASGYDSVIHFFDDTDFGLPNCIAENRVAGIVVIGKIADDNLAVLVGNGIPIVLVDYTSLVHPVTSIVSDSKAGGYLATQYLLERGFTEIGFFGDLSYSLSIRERHFGFLMALDNLAPALVQQNAAYSISEKGTEEWVRGKSIDKLSKRLADMPKRPKAFVCSNDFAAIALCNAAHAIGLRVPQDISLIGFDNIDLCKMNAPKITTINVGMSAMGRKAAERLLYLIEHPSAVAENIVMRVDLIERESVAVPEDGQSR